MRRPHLFALLVTGLLAAPSAASAAPCPVRADDALLLDAGARASCITGSGERAVFAWVPAGPGPVVADLEGTAFDAILDVHRAGRDGALGERIATWDQGDPRAAEHLAFDPEGDRVLLVVRAYRAADAGTVSIGVRRGAPANATPDGAQPIALGDDGLGAAGMHWGFTSPAGLGSASLPARWFGFAARRGGRMTASTCTRYAGDTVLAAYRVEGDGSLTLLASNDDSPLPCEREGASFTGFAVDAGAEYRLAVWPAKGWGDGPDTVVLGWDDAAPSASVDVGPAGVVSERSAEFAWSSPAADAVAFECSLDGAEFARCAAAYGGLADGVHAFRVRALDAAGNVGPAAERTWQVASAAAAAASSARRRVTVETQRVAGARSARARGLAQAFDGGPRARFASGPRGTSVLVLALPGLRPGSAVQVRCERRGNGCPFLARTVKEGTDLARLFRGRRLSAGAVLELRVTRPGTVGRVFRWEMRRGRRPRATVLCLPPGTARVSRC
jgi:hypothetical protein